MIGQRIAHYEITEKIGAGGMGEVYRARDTRLGREVAIKVLAPEMAGDPERRARFRREAMAVAALQHPNIVTIYTVEEEGNTLFLTMELIQGHALDHHIPPHGMNLAQLLDIAIPVVEAVRFAHEKGITHRDLKPANIMVDGSGRPRILDFGLAKLLEISEATAQTLAGDGSVTREGTVLGTASYMSPEQAEGRPTDARSDIFSLGIILYEMATGQKPFTGDTTISTISSILKDTPVSVTDLNRSLPNHLGRVVTRCLAKDPSRRYQTAVDLRNELEGLREESSEVTGAPVPVVSRAKPGARRPFLVGGGLVLVLAVIVGLWRPWGTPAEDAEVGSLPPPGGRVAESGRKMAVVFPFENLGPPEEAYFAAGITEEITSRLSAVSGLGVISRTSAVQFDRAGKTMKQIGRQLGVDYVLEGTVRWARSAGGTGRVRITPQLVRAEDDVHLWSQTYDREIHDIFEVQTDIANRVIQELGITLLGNESELVEERPTKNLDAYQAYLQAIDLTADDFESWDTRTVQLLETATRLDPEFLAAWYKLCRHHADMYRIMDRTEERLGRARSALRGAEAVDRDHPFTHLAQGYYSYYGFRDYDRALAEFRVALEARPNDAEAQRSVGYILRRQGDLEGCIEALERALELDPQNTEAIGNLASTYEALRRFEEALPLVNRLLALEPDHDEHYWEKSTLVLAATGDLAAARAVLRPEPADVPIVHALAWYVLHMSERDFKSALEKAEGIETASPFMGAARLSLIAIARVHLEGARAARPALEAAARASERLLEVSPSNAQLRSGLATVYAYLGNKEAAVREAKLAVDLTAKDAFSGPQQLETLAAVYTWTGRIDEAIELVDRLLATPYEDPLTLHTLRLNPQWDPLRDHPEYESLLEEHGPRVP